MGNFARRNGECHVTVKAGNTPCVAARQVPEQQEEPEAVDYELTDAGFGYARVSLLSHSRAPSATQHSAQLAQGGGLGCAAGRGSTLSHVQKHTRLFLLWVPARREATTSVSQR